MFMTGQVNNGKFFKSKFVVFQGNYKVYIHRSNEETISSEFSIVTTVKHMVVVLFKLGDVLQSLEMGLQQQN